MKVEALAIPEVLLLTPQQFADPRGVFVETWHAARYAALGISGPFVQDNQSLSIKRGTVRGLHLQVAPNVQGKLVRCLRGSIWDVAVDVRPGSPTYGKHVAAQLTAANWCQLWIPGGFLHGFCTLEPDTDRPKRPWQPPGPGLWGSSSLPPGCTGWGFWALPAAHP